MSLMDKIRQKRAQAEAAQKAREEAPATLEEIAAAKQPSNDTHQEQENVSEPIAEETQLQSEPEVTREKTVIQNDNVGSEDKSYETLEAVAESIKSVPEEAVEEEQENEAEDTQEEISKKIEEEKQVEEKKEEEVKEEKPKRRGRPRKADKKEEHEEEIRHEDSANSILAAIEEEIEEEEKKEKPKKKSKHTKEEALVAPLVTVDVLGDQINVDEATAQYLNYFSDDAWKEKEQYFLEKVSNIRIEADMNPGTLKFVLADLCALNDELMPHYLEQKKIYDSLVNKDFGSATAFKIANSVGNNSEERKRSGILALMDAEINGQKINYISLINAVQMRYGALHEIMKMIKYKSDICITMSSAIKTELALTNN